MHICISWKNVFGPQLAPANPAVWPMCQGVQQKNHTRGPASGWHVTTAFEARFSVFHEFHGIPMKFMGFSMNFMGFPWNFMEINFRSQSAPPPTPGCDRCAQVPEKKSFERLRYWLPRPNPCRSIFAALYFSMKFMEFPWNSWDFPWISWKNKFANSRPDQIWIVLHTKSSELPSEPDFFIRKVNDAPCGSRESCLKV